MSRRLRGFGDAVASFVISGLFAYAVVTSGGPVWAGIATFSVLFVLWSIFDELRAGLR